MTPRNIRRVLLTGAGGRIGRVLRERLAGRFEVLRLSDINDMGPANPCEDIVPCDLADAAGVERLCEGMDAVIHMGGLPTESAWDKLIPANVIGTINIYEGARIQGVDRVLLASSNHVTGFYKRTDRLTVASPTKPDGRYAAAKVFGEQLGYVYAHKYGVRGFIMRIGSFGTAPASERARATWLSHGDAARLVMTGLTADYRHAVVFGISRNAGAWWDNAEAHALGYEPQDRSEDHAHLVVSSTGETAATPSGQLQGGAMAELEFTGDLDALL